MGHKRSWHCEVSTVDEHERISTIWKCLRLKWSAGVSKRICAEKVDADVVCEPHRSDLDRDGRGQVVVVNVAAAFISLLGRY